jgi:hypothetical protein
MGGPGSGNFGRRRHCIEDCVTVRLADLRRFGTLSTNHRWRDTFTLCWQGEVVQTITITVHAMEDAPSWMLLELMRDGRQISQRIELDCRRQPFGGWRWHALCPLSGKPCSVLALPPDRTFFASPKGHRLTYASQHERELERAARRRDKALARLDALSRFAHRRTRRGLLAIAQEADEYVHRILEEMLAKA